MTSQADVLLEVLNERYRQDEKWGQQNHPDGTGPDLILRDLEIAVLHGSARAGWFRWWAQERCKRADGGDTYERILTEEWAEAIASPAGSPELRRELIQVAAVAVAWVEKLDREAEDRS